MSAPRKPSRAEVRERERLRKMSAGRRRSRAPWRADPRAMRCTARGNKLRYSSRAAAENALREIMLRGGVKQQSCRVYECETCGGWHCTSKERWSA